MTEVNFCKCAEPSEGPTKSTANSFSFQVCDGDELVTVPASNIADYIINVIYGDVNGNPPSAGCYNVCFDSNGNRTISLVSSPNVHREYVLKEYETIASYYEADPDGASNTGWTDNYTNPTFFTFNSQPPVGFSATYAKLKFRSNFGGSSTMQIDIRDKHNNPVYYVQGLEGDDDGGHTAEVWVPVDLDGNDQYGVFLTGSAKNTYYEIKLVGYSNSPTLNADGSTEDEITGGGIVIPSEPASENSLEITYLKHVHNISGPDVTTVEWVKDDTLVGTDEYVITLDLGGTIHNQTVTHVANGSSGKQRLIVNWTTGNTVRIDAVVSQNGNFGNPRTSNFGSSDTIPVLFETSVTVA